jgi:glycosyltransferase involved in cell wall biosynthesis
VNVLILHNRYREPGGEERSVSAIAALLSNRGHSVEVLERESEAAGRVRAGAGMLAGGLAPREVAEAVRRHRADVVHAHNLNPLFGVRAARAARRAGARVIVHLHNYRLVCAIAICFRDGEVCTRCRGRNTWPGVRLRCRGNLPEAATYGAGLALHQRRLAHAVDRFVVPSEAALARLRAIGAPAGDAAVLPNFVGEAELADAPPAGEPRHALYAGRLVEEKGVATAIEAAARAGVPLAVAGSGPQEAELRGLAARVGAPVTFLGRLEGDELARVRRAAAFSVLPSRWEEPCPYAALESIAAGVPVLASDIGGLPAIAGRENALPPRGAEAWAAAMRRLWEDADARRAAGEAALARARAEFGEERFYSGLMAVYTQ